MSYKDSLTGLPDREALRGALDTGIRAGDTVALAVLDVDHFGEINTEVGHEVGDRVLQTVAEAMEAAASMVGGEAYRLSGDEFALRLPGLTLEQAFLRAEALREGVLVSLGQLRLGARRETTVTVGVAQYPRDAKATDALFQSADAALLAAKEQGRNSVGLPPNEEMVMKSCYYPSGSVRKLKVLSERLGRKESVLLREALSDLIGKYDRP